MSSKAKSLGKNLADQYDLIVLGLVFVAMLASGIFLLMRIGQEQTTLSSGKEITTPGNITRAAPLETESFEQINNLIEEPLQVEAHESKLMISELRVRSANPEAIPAPIPFYAKVCPFTGAEQPGITKYDSDLDGMPDEYEIRYGLNVDSADDAYFDLDGDGFQNLEEYSAGTDPSDAKVFPSILAKLRLFQTRTKPFLMLFKGVQKMPDGGIRYQLNMRTKDKTYFVEMGGNVEGYTLKSFEQNVFTNGNRKVDKSRLILQQGTEQVTLIKDEVRNISETLIRILSLLDKTPITTRIDETFSYKDQKFKVLGLHSAGVDVLDLQTHSKHTINRITEEEKAQLRGVSAEMQEINNMMPDGMTPPVMQRRGF